MVLERKKPMKQISDERLKEFGGRMPYNSLEKPVGQRAALVWRKPPADTGPDRATVELVLRRDSDASGTERCTCCGDELFGRRGFEWCIAHRKLRAQGVDNSAANLYASCMACERETHAGPERARQAGWMLRSTENPEEIPMEHAVHGTVLLINDGTFVVIQAVVAREEFDEHPF